MEYLTYNIRLSGTSWSFLHSNTRSPFCGRKDTLAPDEELVGKLAISGDAMVQTDALTIIGATLRDTGG